MVAYRVFGSPLTFKLLGFWLSSFGLGLGSRLASKLLISRLLAMHLPHWIAPLASLGFGLPWASMFWLGFGLALGVYVLAQLWASLQGKSIFFSSVKK